jgi:hypothetical protein
LNVYPRVRARMGSTCSSGFLSSLVSNPQILHLSAFRLSTRPSSVSLSHPLGLSSHQSLSTTDLPLLCSEVSRISLAMAHILTVVLSTLLALVIVVYAPVRFAETEYIDVATDKIQDLESSLFEILGINPLSVHILRSSPSAMVRGTIQSAMLCTVSVPS